MRRTAAGLSLLLLAGCGLPLPGSVSAPKAVTAEQRPGGDIQVLPPGPRDDAPADEIVRNFFGAQSNPANGHASAREFLAPELRSRWRDTGPVSVVGSGLEPVQDRSVDSYRVTGQLVGRISADGSFSPARGVVNIPVALRKGPRGRWVITAVPDGLVLSTADRDRSFRPHSIYFLAPGVGSSPPTHLVPDVVFLPVTADSADALVRRLLAGPSRLLADSVQTSFPAGTLVRSVRTDTAGLVTVDLSQQVSTAAALSKEQMSAQLVWTLRGVSGVFSQLRLRGAGKDVAVGGAGSQPTLQDRAAWPQYDPDGLSSQAQLFYIGGRRLRLLDPTTGPAADASGRQVVDVAAASRGRTLALLTQVGRRWELRTGPSSGPFALRARGADLSSPSWGSGEQGVWFLSAGRLTLAPVTGPVVPVAVDGSSAFGPLSGLRVSRDGARVGFIAGTGAGRRLVVGRVLIRGDQVRVVGLRNVAPGVTDVRALCWDSATSLVVLGRASGVIAPVRVAVDGSSVALVYRPGLELQTPLTIAAAPDRPLEVGVKGAALFRDSGDRYTPEQGIVGAAPFYPG